MVKLVGIELAPFNLPLERRLQTLSVLFSVTLFTFGGITGTFLCLSLLFTPLFWISLLYLAWFYYDINTCNRGGRRLNWIRRWGIWKHFRDYFPVKLIKTADLDPKRNYLMGYHPHGIICAGAISNFLSDHQDFQELFPNIKPYVLTLEGQFWCPVYREYLNAVGVCAASRESIKWIMSREGLGNAATLVIGGAEEALDSHPGSLIILTLRRRKGFVRLALTHGACLVPMFSFGENELYWQMRNPAGSLLRSIQSRMTKVMGFCPPVLKGRGVFQYSMGMLPYRRPITTVVGRPIDLEKVENPTQARIDEVHAQYIQSLQELFEENKAKYGAADMKLVIN